MKENEWIWDILFGILFIAGSMIALATPYYIWGLILVVIALSLPKKAKGEGVDDDDKFDCDEETKKT